MRSKGIVPAVIRFFTHSPVAHVYVYVGLQPNGYDMVEALPSGVSWGFANEYPDSQSYPCKDHITPEQSALMVAAAIKAVDQPYGWLADFFIGLRQALDIPVPRRLFKLKSVTRHAECAQLADFVAIQGGVQYFDDGRLPGEVSPADLWRRNYDKK